LALAIAGCGEQEDTQSTARDPFPPIRGPKPPKGASPVLRELYRNFPAPAPNTAIPGSAGAIAAGQADCAGKTPLEVARRYISESELSAEQRQAVAGIARHERQPSANFPAGQLAALVYQGTFAGPLAIERYRGCVYALAQGLKRELAP